MGGGWWGVGEGQATQYKMAQPLSLKMVGMALNVLALGLALYLCSQRCTRLLLPAALDDLRLGAWPRCRHKGGEVVGTRCLCTQSRHWGWGGVGGDQYFLALHSWSWCGGVHHSFHAASVYNTTPHTRTPPRHLGGTPDLRPRGGRGGAPARGAGGFTDFLVPGHGPRRLSQRYP